jgi:hypothetical protein
MADDKFSKEESERRFRASLLGARIAGPMPKKKAKVKKSAKNRKKKSA